MNRTKLRFLFTPLWIINIIFQFGFLFEILPKNGGELDIRILSLITIPLLFSLYLIIDIFLFKRPTFLRIIGIWFLFNSLVYLFMIFKELNISSFIYAGLLLASLFSGLYISKKIWLKK